MSLRYFNAAGADERGEIGEKHELETHLIPLGLAVSTENGPELQIYGSDYPTADRTCLREEEDSFPAKKETGRLGPVSEAPVATRLHRTARLAQSIAGVVHVRLFISRQQSVQKERGNMRNRRSNYGASVRFCATVLIVSAT